MLSFLLGIILLSAGILGAFFFDSFWAVLIYVLFVHITPIQLHLMSLRPSLVIAIVMIFTYVIDRQYSPLFRFKPFELVCFATMLFGMLLGSFNAYDNDLAFSQTSYYMKYFLFYIFFVNIINSKYKLTCLYNSFIISSAWLVYRCFDLRGTTGARFENIGGGIVGDSNQFAGALILLMPFVFLKVVRSENIIIKFCALLGIFGIFMSIMITVSRSGFLGFIAMLIMLLILFKKYRTKIIFFIIALSIIAAPFINEYHINRLLSVFSSEKIDHDESSQSRLAFWKTAYEVWKQKPIYGCGMRNIIYYTGYMNEGLNWGEPGHVVHNIWLEALCEGGVLVFIPFVIIIILFFYRTIAAKKKFISNHEIIEDISALQAGMIGFLVVAFFVNRLLYEPIYWWCALSYIYQKVIE